MSEHKTRYSDSSLYDEVCTICGKNDGDGPLENKPCTEAPAPAQPTPTCPVCGSYPCKRTCSAQYSRHVKPQPAQPTPADTAAKDCARPVAVAPASEEEVARRLVRIDVMPVGEHGKFRGESDLYRVLVGHMDALKTTCEKGASDCADEYRRVVAAAIHEVADPLRAENVALRDRVKELERERDLAVAHDRQPYPTAEAYELVCKARAKWQARAEAVERQLELCQEKLTRWQLFTSGKDQGYNDDTALVEWLDKEITTLFSALKPKAASPEKKEQG